MARGAERLGWAEAGTAARICACLAKNALPISTAFSPEALALSAASDKKRAGSEITVVIPEAIGRCTLKKIPLEDLLPIIRAGWEE